MKKQHFLHTAAIWARTLLPWTVAAVGIAPLIFINGLYFPAVAPKTFFIETIGIVAVALFVFSALCGEGFYWSRLKRWQTWLPGGLLAVEYITSFFGIDFYQSFWGLMVRGDGLLMSTILVALFYITVLVADDVFWKRVLLVITSAASLSALAGLLQWVGGVAGFAVPFLPQSSERVSGFFGNPGYLGAFLALAGFTTLWLRTQYYARGTYARVLLGLATMQFLVALLTATRGVMLGLLAAALVSLAYSSFAKGASTRLYARIALCALAVLFIAGAVLRGPLAHSSFEPVKRLAQLSFTDATVASRLFVWNGIVTEAFKRPIAGVGAEHVTQLFDRIYDPTKLTEEWFDRSHNAYLDYFAQFGIGGFALYGAVVTLLILGAYRRWRKGEGVYAYIALAGLVYAVQVFFAFDIPLTLFMLLLFFAAVEGVGGEVRNLSFTTLRAMGGVVLAVGVLCTLYPVVYKPFVANRALIEAYLYHVSDVNRSVGALQRGFNEHTYMNLEYGHEIEDMYVNQQQHLLSGDALRAVYAVNANLLVDIYNRYNYDARSALNLAQVLDLAPQGVEPNLVFQATVANRARQLSPLRSEAWYLLVNADIVAASEAKSGNEALLYFKDAIGVMEEYHKLVPALSRPKLVLAQLYLTIGDPKSAEVYVADLRKTDPAILASDPDLVRVIEAYERGL